jgi:type II secretory pathway component GspD/PulD (secretin)
MPTARIVAEVTPNTITLTGPAGVLTTAREYVRMTDVPAAASTAELAVVRLKHTNAAEVVKVLEKAHGSTGARFTADAASNVVVLSAPPGAMANLKKRVAELDQPTGPAK